jgi:hypothetical protein
MDPSRYLALSILCASFTACGDPLVDGRFEGDAIASMHGVICGREIVSKLHAPSVGVIWAAIGPDLVTAAKDTEPVLERRLPIDFELSIFDPPPSEMMGGDLIGIPVLVDDLDGDGSFNAGQNGVHAPDELIGVSTLRVLRFENGAFTTVEAVCGPNRTIAELHPSKTNASIDITPFPQLAILSDADAPPSRCLTKILERSK